MNAGASILVMAAGRGVRAIRGFTLLELMVTLAVLGVIASIAIPSMTTLINNNRLAASTSELAAGLQLARSEAIRRNSQVEICGTLDGQGCAPNEDWAHWVVLGTDRDTGASLVLRDYQAPDGVDLVGPSTPIVFSPKAE